MGKPIGSRPRSRWEELALCRNLTPEQADAIFFPSGGGKSNKAQKFCESCPVLKECLQNALEKGAVGFWAGTTEPERRRMIEFLQLIPSQLDTIPDVVPVRPKYRKITPNENPLNDPLFGVDGPSDDELSSLENLRAYGM